MQVIAIIPAHNEVQRIASTITGARRIEGLSRVIVVDDGSTDGTGKLALQSGAEVIRLDRNVGKGAALQAGLDLVRNEATIVLLLDADLGESASQGVILLEPVHAGAADMTVAILPKPPGSGGFGLVKGLARIGIARLGKGFEASAPLSGQRALNRSAWESATPFASGYGAEVALTIRALRAGLRVLEVPAVMTHAATGRDAAGFAHRGRQFMHVATTLARLAFERG
ncbi:MAG: glycosyltransferase family 2 protein [Actinomycetota bacterium]|nr:MAG: glycosyl transferase family [Actinomycetota bacterium]MDO8949349.1 glycosyltransferase family 2 protein [Actinomycetota bacterium]MDP3630079.1 glycosyltransferase family 2 protein [Actinomycetota bacterium]